MAASDRSAIDFYFVYPSVSLYGATSSSTFSTGTSVLISADEPVVGSQVSVIDRDTGSPATVYQAETGTSTYSSMTTDSNGHVIGWVDSGSYRIQVAPQGNFGGATVNFEAYRGDGITRIAPGAVTRAAIANDSVDIPQLSPAVQAEIAELELLIAEIEAALALPAGGQAPPGTIAYSFTFPTGEPFVGTYITPGNPPVLDGWLFMNGQIVSVAAYPDLFDAIGYNFSYVDSGPYFALPIDPFYVSGYDNFLGSIATDASPIPIIKY